MDIDLKHVTLSASWNRGRVMAALVLGALLSSCGVPAAEEPSIGEPIPSRPESQEGSETIDAAASEELFALLAAEPNPLNVALVLEEGSASNSRSVRRAASWKPSTATVPCIAFLSPKEHWYG